MAQATNNNAASSMCILEPSPVSAPCFRCLLRALHRIIIESYTKARAKTVFGSGSEAGVSVLTENILSVLGAKTLQD